MQDANYVLSYHIIHQHAWPDPVARSAVAQQGAGPDERWRVLQEPQRHPLNHQQPDEQPCPVHPGERLGCAGSPAPEPSELPQGSLAAVPAPLREVALSLSLYPPDQKRRGASPGAYALLYHDWSTPLPTF